MDKNTLKLLKRLFYETKDVLSNVFSKENLSVFILPVESEVLDANRLPVVWELWSRAVHDSCHFISDYELQILL